MQTHITPIMRYFITVKREKDDDNWPIIRGTKIDPKMLRFYIELRGGRLVNPTEVYVYPDWTTSFPVRLLPRSEDEWLFDIINQVRTDILRGHRKAGVPT